MIEPERNPAAYLKMAKQAEEKEKKGKLKIFFGYAAGVGKTYAMLSAAKKEKEAGTDIVIGYLEPHARPDTQKKAEGLPFVPTREMQINRITVQEMDIDAILKRAPKVVLVDEMAHTNADGCRHPKRYQDILELLNAGIDVYTTLNVQHIESVHDKVAAITGVAVRERIPDSVFDRADSIKMVDIQPEELLERLSQGKIYKRERAAQALDHFFSEENLIALREIALRRMADWLNNEQDEMIANGRKENASEHIMMCLSAAPSNAKVIRQAAKLANAFHGKFTAFYVETPDDETMDAADAQRLNENRKLAAKFGAKIVTSFGNEIVEQIAEYAKVARVTKIVLGRTNTMHPPFSVKESIAERLAALVPNLEIFLIPDLHEKRYVKKKKKVQINRRYVLGDAGIGLSILLITTLVSAAFDRMGFEEANLIMLYVLGSTLVALCAKHYITGILYGVAAILTFNLLFTEPRYTLTYYNAGYVVTFFIFFVVSLIISILVRKVKLTARENAKKAYRTGILLETSQLLQEKQTEEEIAANTARQIGRLLNRSTCCFIGSPEGGREPQYYEIPGRRMELSEQERAVAVWSYKNNKSAGATTSTLPGAKNLFLTIRNGEKIFGLAGIDMCGNPLNAFEESVMLAILSESALAFEKVEKTRREQEMAVELEQEKFRANLLRSISHDFRTPLTVIYGNMDMLLREDENMSAGQRKKIYQDIGEDASWLLNLVENLLSVTRIENGTIRLNRQPELLEDVVWESLLHLSRRAKEHEIVFDRPKEFFLVKMDVKLMIQVIINLVDNAVKYTPAGSVIGIQMYRVGNRVRLEVRDNGEGIPDDRKERIFDMFYTMGKNTTDCRRGMGLGLALCKSIVEAHDGRIWVEDNLPKGAVFIIDLKLEEAKEHEA
ncbi:MAG: sensor histidine kinase KdpD [Roseburia sp.]|nr:sensor histidine kinase KdpD [Roseburia sp.]